MLGYYNDHDLRNLNRYYPGFAFNCLAVPHLEIKNEEVLLKLPRDNTRELKLIASYFNYASGLESPYSFGQDFYWTALNLQVCLRNNSSFSRQYLRDFSIHDREISTEYILEKFNVFCEEIVTEFIVLYIPKYIGGVIEPMPDHLSRTLISSDINYIDMTSNFEIQNNRQNMSLEIPHDQHLTPIGQALIADELSKIINSK